MSTRGEELRRVLMVAFHFPPLTGSSGIQRTLRFAQYLPEYGWHPLILTAHPRAYACIADDLLPEVDANLVVERAFALDTARHLALGGRYPGVLARPDRWISWWLGAVPTGLAMIRRYRPSVLWSTYPIATAHRIALTLHKLTGVPLVMDFRDPMAQAGYPEDPKVWASFSRIEQDAARRATRLVFVTPGALELYKTKFPELPADRLALVENGYDEESFSIADEVGYAALNPGRFTLVHSGIVYPSERDPTALMQALGRLRRSAHPAVSTLRVRFRAAIHDDLVRRLAEREGVADLVEALPALPYRDALREMMNADGLLVMQGRNCNEQVPAKLYEYFRARRPILGLADVAGDTGRLMRDAGVVHIAPLEEPDGVAGALSAYMQDAAAGVTRLLPISKVSSMARRARTGLLAELLDGAASGGLPRRSAAPTAP
jgi:hypothetical protein